MSKTISIIIPVYNAEKYILKCLDSISDQSFLNYEVILINDGSKDRSEEIINNYIEEKHSWFLFSKENEGVAIARNLGIDKATGDYITFVDADDFIEKEYLNKLYRALINNNCDLACCGYYDHSSYGILSLNNYKNHANEVVEINEFSHLLFSQIGGVLWDKLFDATIIKGHKLKMNLDIYYYEDSIFILDYLQFIDKIAIIDEPLYNYNRINETSFTNKIDYTWKNNVINYNKKIESSLIRLNLKPIFIHSIIRKNIYGFISMILLQKLYKYKISVQYKIALDLVSDSYIRNNYHQSNLNVIDKVLLFFFNYKMVALIIIYSSTFNFLKKFYLKLKALF